MSRYLEFFEPATASSLVQPLETAYARGARRALLAGQVECSQVAREYLRRLGFSYSDRSTKAFQAPDFRDCDLLVITGGSAGEVSQMLHACIEANVEVIAPVTEHHISKRTVFLLSIPKAGTHMLIRLFDLLGLERSSDRAPRPGAWSTPVGYHYHAPCREFLANDWIAPVGRQLFFRSPAIFVYRNPLDILISELDWFMKSEHAFSGCLNYCADDAERLRRLIADDTVMGSIRDRINRYVGWLNFGNVMPVSYEELVGSRGGGSDALQSNSIWALQLKLHVSGSPEEYGRRIYDTTSATFSKGRIGRHREHLRRKHYALFASLPQDFMQALGYTKRQMTSSRIMEFMHRPLMIKDVPADLLYTPKLVREDLLGWNIIELAGQYFPIPQGEPIESPTAAQAFFGRQQGYMSLTEAANAVVRCNPAPNFAASADRTTTLVIEGFLGFNVIQHHGRWYGFHQALGPLDIGNLDAATIDAMMKRRQCVTGEDVADIKAEILGLTVQTQRLWRAKQQPTNPSGADTAHRLQEVASRIDAEHIERATELKSVQDRLKDLERQIAELSQPLANLDR